ncbi:MAG: zinc dependent phospholipase C family protein [Eggerthellaceae bacterium]|nr:zinc dependent phospholipase C family protein [Eggerthellaceae bacterium]
MPAVLTHDFFGRDVLDAFGSLDNASIDERDAFLLGNQGPDPLFFLALTPTQLSWRKLGSTMHRKHPTELLHALGQSLNILRGDEVDIGHAYALGFLCHYVLDSMEHPLIYATQYAICDAGVEGLERSDGHEVHTEIERELDEMVLFAKRGQTTRVYSPVDNTLEANAYVLEIVHKMYAYVALTVYGEIIQGGLFPLAVSNYRFALSLLYSPLGIKRSLLGMAERSIRSRSHSFLQAMAYKGEEVHDSWYANSEHKPWANPYTGEIRTDSFWDIYESAIEAAGKAIERFETTNFTLEDARVITREINFSGEPTVATLTIEA